MQGRYYTFSNDLVQYFALDTNNLVLKTQFKWLEQALTESIATWKIVFAHHTLYFSGIHRSNEKLINMLSPLFKRYGVQLYINNHDRN